MRQKDDKKVEKIFSATLQLVEQSGLSGITMCDISKAAGIATGTLYIYFRSKEELINELFSECRRESADIYFEDYDESEDFKDSLKKIFNNIIRYRLSNFRESIFLEQCYHSPFVSETKRQEFAKFLQPFFQLLEKGKMQGLIKNEDSLFLLWFIFGCINEPVKRFLYSKRKVTANVIESLFNMCWDALKN